MVTRLAPDARSIVKNAEAEARSHRSSLVEAEHLLLALSRQAETDAAGVLAAVGLFHSAIETALSREFESSLATAGVSASLSSLRQSSPDPSRRLRLGASFKAAMVRAVRAAEDARQIRPAHLLLGVVEAQAGTVPRALHLAGVDQTELIDLTRRALTD